MEVEAVLGQKDLDLGAEEGKPADKRVDGKALIAKLCMETFWAVFGGYGISVDPRQGLGGSLVFLR